MKTLEEDKDPDAPIVKGIVAELDHAGRPLNPDSLTWSGTEIGSRSERPHR
jgi:hypothetical protein